MDGGNKLDYQPMDIYAALGKFLVAFELAFFFVRDGIKTMSDFLGLKNGKIVDILLAGLSYANLLETYRAMIPHLVDLDKQDEDVIKNIFERFYHLKDERNEVVHTTWFAEWRNSPEEDSRLSGVRFKKNKKSKPNFPAINVDKLSALYSEASELYKLINRLSLCLSFRHKVAKNFRIDEKGNVRIPSQNR